MGTRVIRFIPNTPVLVTWGQKPTTGQLSDFINGRTEGNILNQQASYSAHELIFILQDDMSTFIQILHPWHIPPPQGGRLS